MGPIYNIVLEGHLLHALTETGLESYTTRIGHKLCRDLEVIDDISNVNGSQVIFIVFLFFSKF